MIRRDQKINLDQYTVIIWPTVEQHKMDENMMDYNNNDEMTTPQRVASSDQAKTKCDADGMAISLPESKCMF